ncbi:DUF5652 family protein [Gordonia neofelifaecis]|uniref:DUF5652 domain-containing protein n=1 Tax=Gordonia neofelifaecis NRRL B-59395 TaxID=644548 RepID=F1YJ92_9ACTN|nr:DUF5652 family protein [Gordonia neofelifaecis]EGD55125.1 hypothetical protein SCNU_09644 [Gordonia neofelifaecis NRRL B-59395]
MAKKWSELPPAARAGIISIAAVDAGLRVWAIRDLRSRDKKEVNGSKLVWSAALSVVNSAGVLPAVYLLRGRRATPAGPQ